MTNPVVNALVVARNKEEVLTKGKAVEQGLGKPFSIRRKVHDLVVAAVSRKVPQRAYHHIYPNHHTRPSTVGVIVDSAVRAVGVEVMDSDGNEAFFLGAPQDRTLEGRVEDFRHSRKYVDVHGSGEPQEQSAFFYGLASGDEDFSHLTLRWRKKEVFHFHRFQYEYGGCRGDGLADLDAHFPYKAGHRSPQLPLLGHRPLGRRDPLEVRMQGRVPLYFQEPFREAHLKATRTAFQHEKAHRSHPDCPGVLPPHRRRRCRVKPKEVGLQAQVLHVTS